MDAVSGLFPSGFIRSTASSGMTRKVRVRGWGERWREPPNGARALKFEARARTEGCRACTIAASTDASLGRAARQSGNSEVWRAKCGDSSHHARATPDTSVRAASTSNDLRERVDVRVGDSCRSNALQSRRLPSASLARERHRLQPTARAAAQTRRLRLHIITKPTARSCAAREARREKEEGSEATTAATSTSTATSSISSATTSSTAAAAASFS